ncbi:hypothetical protein [Lacinutrix chionoecetis]
MKRAILILLLASFMCVSCNNTSKTDKTIDDNIYLSDKEQNPIDVIEAEQESDLANAYFYVLAPNGLSLRKSDILSSEKLLTIPFGAKLKQTAPIYTVDLAVENIEGSMMQVLYEGKTGYVFSGFLSAFPPLEKEEKNEDYITRLKAVNPNAVFESKDTPQDFHQGTVETLTLPATQWHEAFYLAKANYNIPKSFNFPGHKGNDKETVSEKDKDSNIWSSDLFISRAASRLDTIQYNWRAEGSGYFVVITKPEASSIKIEYTGFAD